MFLPTPSFLMTRIRQRYLHILKEVMRALRDELSDEDGVNHEVRRGLIIYPQSNEMEESRLAN